VVALLPAAASGAPTPCPRLREIAPRYDALFCDVWGVVHDGRRAFAAACEALIEFRRGGGAVVLITNAPVPHGRVIAVLDRLRAPAEAYDAVVASGDVTRDELARRAPGPVYAIGVREDSGALSGYGSVYAGLGVELTADPAAARLVCCTGLREYPDGDPETYRAELAGLAARGLPMVCANPDVQFRHGDALVWAAGSLARIYEQEGGTVIRPGKPDAAIYRVARDEVARVRGAAVADDRVLAIGDGPATDILGANREGIDALFIGGGIHGEALGEGADFHQRAAALLADDGVHARYAAPALAW
jgi:HAD superfamily hydrolase (TIGR01459 family)